MPEDKSIRAAGSIVWRHNDEGAIEVSLIHRPKYNDWSFPKGKQEEGESAIACAYRETIEETGFEVRFHQSLGQVSYESEGALKCVSYWSAKFLQQVGRPNHSEVDEISWVGVEKANAMLTRSTDKEILQRLLSKDLDSKTLILLRHAKAVAREEWQSEDLDRPLSAMGQQQAKRLTSLLNPFKIREIHSSSAVRCYETVSPLARALSLDYFFTDSLTEYIFSKNPHRTFKYIDRLLENDHTTLVCGHNPILPKYLSEKYSKQGFDIMQSTLKPAEAWVIHHIGKEVIEIDHLEAPFTA